jgi:hypothetical protein
MPWYFEDVLHDYDTAHELTHTLGYGAIGLAEALAILEADIPVVVEDWEGRARWVFDEEMRATLAAGHQLVAVLQAAGASVMAAHESASAESQLRAELREAYRAELAALPSDRASRQGRFSRLAPSAPGPGAG